MDVHIDSPQSLPTQNSLQRAALACSCVLFLCPVAKDRLRNSYILYKITIPSPVYVDTLLTGTRPRRGALSCGRPGLLALNNVRTVLLRFVQDGARMTIS